MAKVNNFAYEVTLNRPTIENMPIEDLRKLLAYHFSLRPYSFGSSREEALRNLEKDNIGISSNYFITLPREKK